MENKKKSLSEMESISVSDLVKQEYREYQLYTLLDRAIPYLVDGLKPAQRRILYILYKNMNKGLSKVSSTTGLVLSLHPHGPVSIEGSIVNMAQNYVFSNNYPLIDKKGYFGERMESDPAASRYIECKLSNMAEFLLFDDLNQVPMIQNYDERMLEPAFLLPKLPLMLLNGAEGIGTGYSSVIPSFHHKDLIDSMINVLNTGKAKKIKPYVDGFKNDIVYDKEKNRYLFNMKFEKINGGYYITELPKGFDAKKIYSHLNKFIEEDFIKDYIDSSVKNDIKIELVFKKGFNPRIETVSDKIDVRTSLVPNYTLISDAGVEVFNNAEEIIEIFTNQRMAVVKKRYELFLKDAEERIEKNNEIIRFIKEQHYSIAEKKKDRAEYLKYLQNNKFKHFEYLADMAIYRMTKDEVGKRQLMITEDNGLIKDYKTVLKAKNGIKDKLIEELQKVNEDLNSFLRKKWKDINQSKS
jgi:DNA gyrase subunit A